MKQFVLASDNAHKLEEFQAILAPFGITLISLKDLGLSLSGVNEDALTYEGNALIKAEAIAKHTSLPVISDDSGLSINALNGFPGLNSHRFMEQYSDAEKNAAVLKMLESYEDRSASFHSAIVVLNLVDKPLLFLGEAPGHIMFEAKGTSGFGYDPIFYSDELGHGFAEGTKEEKNKVSHRGKALQKLIIYLTNYYHK